MIKLSPITIFVYNRPWHLKQTIESLKRNKLAKQSELFIFSDGPKNEEDKKKVKKIRRYIRTINGFKNVTIRERGENLGLANSVIKGVTKIVNQYGKIIVLEDDLLTSPYFLQFMNDALNFYEKEKRVASIHGYVFPVEGKLPETFFLKHTGCYGWATWKNKWHLFVNDGKKLLSELKYKDLTKSFDHNNSYPYTKLLESQIRGRTDSWAIKWYASLFLKNKLTLYPGKSLVFYNGSDGSGTHYSFSRDLDTEISNYPIRIKNIKIEESVDAFKEFFKYYKSTYSPFPFAFLKKIIRKVLRLYKITYENFAL